ncbi:MAG TPA: hypothetical protein VFQ61_35490, partial [Polyangiaceae bacterium]|nr:hypothetical protein [Polyangiaceae bacterium]
MPLSGGESRSQSWAVSEPFQGTFRDLALARLNTLGQALPSRRVLPLAGALLNLLDRWAELPTTALGRANLQADVEALGSVFEVGVCVGNRGLEGLRLMIQAEGHPQLRGSNWAESLRFSLALRETFGANLELFDALAPVFTPSGLRPAFTLRHELLLLGPTPSFRLHVVPREPGTRSTLVKLREALQRVGLSEAWEFVHPRMSHEAELLRLCVDLA